MILDSNDVWWFVHWTEATGYWHDLIVVAWLPSGTHPRGDQDGASIHAATALTMCSIATVGGQMFLRTYRGPDLPTYIADEIIGDIANRAEHPGAYGYYLAHDIWCMTYHAEWANPSEYHAEP